MGDDVPHDLTRSFRLTTPCSGCCLRQAGPGGFGQCWISVWCGQAETANGVITMIAKRFSARAVSAVDH